MKPRFVFPSPSLRTRDADWAGVPRSLCLAESRAVEITWFGEGCVRLRGREGTIAADAYRSVVGPTGRGLTADVATYSHADAQPIAATRKGASAPEEGQSSFPAPATVVRPTSLESAFPLEVPGEYEIHDILVTGVRTFRDDVHGAERGQNVAFVYQLDGLDTVHLGDIGHLLDEEMLGEIGTAEVVCVPIGGALTAARAAELVAQLDAKLVIPLTVTQDEAAGNAEMAKFLHEMGAADPTPQPRLTVTSSSIPEESTVIVLESRARS